MPYIKKERRDKIKHGICLRPDHIECAGDMQYAIAIIIKKYMRTKELNYQTCNDVMGALAGAKMEFYRKTVAPYEDTKMDENGDV